MEKRGQFHFPCFPHIRKRGISAVVATVLMILITIAGVTIVWVVIVPMIKENISFEQEMVDLNIETSAGYTVWDNSTGNVSVQVKRGADKGEIIGVQFVISRAGNSVTLSSSEFPAPNQAKLYEFNALSLVGGKPDSIKVAPIFRTKVGSVTSEITKLPSGITSNVDGIVPTNQTILPPPQGECDVAGDCADVSCKTKDCVSGSCQYINAVNGTACDDGNPSTTDDVCTSGVCAGIIPPACTDVDGDKFNITGGDCGVIDCNDGNANINPGKSETPNNDVDENCDNLVGLTQCYTMNVAGVTYTLDNSLSNAGKNCFNITTNNIVFDMKKNSVTGSTGGIGINVTGVNGATLTGVTVQNGYLYNFAVGLYFVKVNYGKIRNMTTNSNIYDGSLAGMGIWINSSSYNDLINNTANSNTGASATKSSSGIYVSFGSNNNNLINNVANSNEHHGIVIHMSSSNYLINNTANSNNGGTGIYLYTTSGNILERNSLTANGLGSTYGAGIQLVEGSNNNEIKQNTACGNRAGLDLRCNDVGVDNNGNFGSANIFGGVSLGVGCTSVSYSTSCT